MKKFLIILLAICTFTLTGCSKTVSPEKQIDAYFADMQTKLEKGGEELGLTGDDLAKAFGSSLIGEEFMDLMVDFDYHIGKVTVDGDEAVAEVTVKTYDYIALFRGFVTNLMNTVKADPSLALHRDKYSEVVDGAFDEAYKTIKKQGKTYETTIDVVLRMDEKSKAWSVNEYKSGNIADALTGQLSGALSDILGEMY